MRCFPDVCAVTTPDFTQQAQVAGHCGLADRELRDEVAHAAVFLGEQLDDAHAGVVGERGEGGHAANI